MTPIPLTLQTLYQDLLQAHLDRAPEEMSGAPHLRKIGGRKFWYASARAPGGAHRQIFIGPDDAPTRARIRRWRGAREDARVFRAASSEKAAALRAARLPALDMTTGKTLRALAEAGAFRLGAVLVGTHPFRLYDLELGARISSTASLTAGIDVAFSPLPLAGEGSGERGRDAASAFALGGDREKSVHDTTENRRATEPSPLSPLPLAGEGDAYRESATNAEIERAHRRAQPLLPEVLASLGFSPVRNRPTRWRMGEFVVDFLAPSFDEKEGPQKLEALGLWAQGLHFLNFLIRDPIPAVALYREGVLVQIPRPERFAVHKLIVAARRRGPGRAKAEKDLAQSRALIAALAEARPRELKTAHDEAVDEGPAWRKTIAASLKRAPELGDLLDGLD